MCFYYIKHGQGSLLDKIVESRSPSLRDVLFRSALYFSLCDANAAPLAAIGNLDLTADQRRLLWGANALLASAQGNELRALRFAVLAGAVPGKASSAAVRMGLPQARHHGVRHGAG